VIWRLFLRLFLLLGMGLVAFTFTTTYLSTRMCEYSTSRWLQLQRELHLIRLRALLAFWVVVGIGKLCSIEFVLHRSQQRAWADENDMKGYNTGGFTASSLNC
jgi:hypothetical protein